MNLTIYLRGGGFAEVNNFSSVVFSRESSKSIAAENIQELIIKPLLTYTFIGNKDSITLNGADILYLQLSK